MLTIRCLIYNTPKMNKINRPAGRKKIIVIVGPTASGKSDLGVELARKFNGEIISADSRQVYKGMDIGTGKVRRDRTLPKLKVFLKKNFYSEGVRHYLLDMVSPKKQFTADDFKKLGEKTIKKILGENKIPIIVGGTGFYIDILLGRMKTASVPPNLKLRKTLDNKPAKRLFEMLLKLDPQRAKTIDRHNKRRLIRALEIILTTKRPSLTTYHLLPTTNYKVLWLGINPGKEVLAKKIKKRLDQRLDQGMIKEVFKLRKQGMSWKRLDNFGLEYRWLSRYLKQFSIFNFQFSTKPNAENFKKSEYYQNLLRDIIKYSKRQMTWFKRNKEIHWLSSNEASELRKAEGLTRKFIYS